MTSFTFSCEAPVSAGKSDNYMAILIMESDQTYEKPDTAEELIDADKADAGAGNISEKSKTGRQGVIAEHDNPAVRIEHNYVIQVGAYKNINYANATIKKLKAMNLCAYITRENNFSKVRIAGIRTKEYAAIIMKEINNQLKLSPILFASNKTSMSKNPCQ